MSKKKDALLAILPAYYILNIPYNFYEVKDIVSDFILIRFKLKHENLMFGSNHASYVYDDCIEFSSCVEEIIIKHELDCNSIYILNDKFENTKLAQRANLWFTYNEFKKWFKKCA